MRNILIFSNTLLLGGAEKQSVLLAKALHQDYNVFYVIYYGEQYEKKYLDILEKLNIDIITLSGSHLKKVLHFYNILKRNEIDIIFSFLATTNLLNGLIGKVAGIETLIGGIRSSLIPWHKLIIQKLIHNYFLNYSVFNNNNGKRRLTDYGFKDEKIVLIPNSIEVTEGFTREDKTKINILSVGRFVINKDYLTSLKAIKNVYEIYNNIDYTIVGYGQLETNIKSWIRELEIEEVVNIIIKGEKIESYYKNADIFLQTSLFEGLSNSIMEAMNHSLPIIATDVGDNERLVVNNWNGYLLPIKQHDLIGKKVLELITSYEKRSAFGKNSYNHVKKNYSLEKFKRRYINLVENLR